MLKNNFTQQEIQNMPITEFIKFAKDYITHNK